MDLQPSDVASGLGYLLQGAAVMLTFVLTPVFWVLRGGLEMLLSAAQACLSVFHSILCIMFWPFLIPWRTMVWWWGLLGSAYQELEPFLPYLGIMAIIGVVASVIVTILTELIVTQLRRWFPFLGPQRHRHRRQKSPRRKHRPAANRRQHQPQLKDTTGKRAQGRNRITSSEQPPTAAVSYYSSSSEESDRAAVPGRYRSLASSSLPSTSATAVTPALAAPPLARRISRRRTPPAGVAVDDTIHEESSTE